MDQYINTTHLIDTIDTVLAKLPPRGNAKSTQDLVLRATLCGVKQVIQGELLDGDFRPVIHAHWIRQFTDFNGNPHARCSKCNGIFIGEERFCCRCGAIMDGND